MAHVKYGPRGGIQNVDFYCGCTYKIKVTECYNNAHFNDNTKLEKNVVSNINDKYNIKYNDDVAFCNICNEKMNMTKNEDNEFGGGLRGLKNVLEGTKIKYGYTITYSCPNVDEHNKVIQKFTCTECECFIQYKTNRIYNSKHDNYMCPKCYLIKKYHIKCNVCNELFGKKKIWITKYIVNVN